MQAQQVDFVVRGIDDLGKPSQALLEVSEVALIDEQGKILRRFRDAQSLSAFLARKSIKAKLVALETVGLPRFDLSGKYCCYEQAAWNSVRQ
jgi:hypothetical protein